MLKNNQKKLVLLKDLGMRHTNSKYKYRFGLYKCHCGNEFENIIQNVNKGQVKSCGCFKKISFMNKSVGVGNSSHKLYNTWNTMIHRCYNKNRKDYKYYGEIGVTVCNEWFALENFINDMYSTFQEGLTLDRINNNLGYSKENCRWTNKNTQQRNKRVIQVNNKSGYKGVDKFGNRFKSRICINSKLIHIGIFNSAEEASFAYNKYVLDNNLEHKLN